MPTYTSAPSLGQVAYEAYQDAHPWPIPDWAQIDTNIRTVWETLAATLRVHVLQQERLKAFADSAVIDPASAISAAEETL
jgi:hypothetical protein